MSLQRFFLGLVLLFLSFISFKFATNPHIKNIAFTVGEVIGSILTGLVIGSIIWAFKNKFTRVDNYAYEVRRFSLNSAVILVSIFIAKQLFLTNFLSKTELLAFSKGFKETCFSTSRILKQNSQLSDLQIQGYCSCVSTRLSKEITKEDFKFFEINQVFPDSFQKKSQKIAKQCAQQSKTASKP